MNLKSHQELGLAIPPFYLEICNFCSTSKVNDLFLIEKVNFRKALL